MRYPPFALALLLTACGSPKVKETYVAPQPTPVARSNPAVKTIPTYVTTRGAMATTSAAVLNQAVEYVAQGNTVALGELLKSGQLFELSPGLEVQRLSCLNESCDRLTIQEIGKPNILYVTKDAIRLRRR